MSVLAVRRFGLLPDLVSVRFAGGVRGPNFRVLDIGLPDLEREKMGRDFFKDTRSRRKPIDPEARR